ncbi:hypothetical protein KAW65_07330 [candidate division WOR-3 bacterium]|nr:hypothetical protein [candidate division WOR-3 bacterium]
MWIYILLLFAQDIKILESGREGIEFIYTSQKLTLEPIPHILNTYTQPETGKPAVPIKYIPIGIPVGAKVKVKVIESITEELRGIDIPPTIGFTGKARDEKLYSSDIFWPPKIVTIEEQRLYRAQEVLKLRINPLRYNPKRKTLLFYKKIRIKVSFEGGTGVPRLDPSFENVFKRALINYEQAKNWRAPRRKRVRMYHPGPWYKIELQDEGIYKITKEQLQNIGILSGELNTIKLYNGGSKMQTDTTDSLIEIPIYVLPDTSILFYAGSLKGWKKNVEGQLFLNPYTNTNVYWLTYGGDLGRRDSISGIIQGSNPVPEYFIDTLHMEYDNLCPSRSGLAWVWERLERESVKPSIWKNYSFSVYGIKEDSCKMKISIYRFCEKNKSDPDFDEQIHRLRLYLNGVNFLDWVKPSGDGSQDILEDSVAGLKEGINTLSLELYRGESDVIRDIIWFNYFEIVYKKKYQAYNGTLKFKGESEDLEFNLHNFQELPVIFDITNLLEPKRVYGAVFEEGIVKFQGQGRTYYASSEFKTVSIKKESPYNLRDRSSFAKFIIITHPDFFDYAERLKKHRETQGMDTEIFSIFDVYNNFSWGLKNSPYAIRNFLWFAYNNWESGYCLLLGAGTYDYKSSLAKNRIPPHEEGYIVAEFGYGGNPCWDGWFTNNIALGRITAKSKDGARNAIEKVIKYDESPGVWQNRILLIADDENPDGNTFVNHEEGLFNIIPSNFDVFKVYLMNYRGDGSPTKSDLIRYFNKGMFMTFFGGHGNLEQLCHEVIFWNPDDIYALNNGLKLPFSFFYSCGVGCFDRQYKDGMADFMQKIKNKGSIGTIAETRAASGSGGIDNRLIETFLQEGVSTIGEGVYKENLSSPLVGTQNLFADPATKLPNRSISVTIDSFPDTLKGGEKLKVTGHAPGANFAYLTVRSSEYTYHYEPSGANYKMRGKMDKMDVDENQVIQVTKDILFEGLSEVENGVWSQEFFIPIIDTTRDPEICGAKGKISIFAWNDNSCGSSGIDTLIVTEGEPDTTDKEGPSITLFADGNLLKNGSRVPEDFTLSGIIEDPSGINIFNKVKPLHLILSEQHGGKQTPLADYFQYDLGSCTRGSFSCPISLEKWATEDTLLVQASDNVGNRSVKSVVLKIASSSELEITDVMNYPNPVKGEHTTFTFFLSKSARVSVKIYTIAGRLIRTIPAQYFIPGPGKRIYWNTRDELGNRVGNGIYIYKIEAISESGLTEEEASKISKLMITR